jgi:SPP1 gp7 family putative phage head morphogenesis protein
MAKLDKLAKENQRLLDMLFRHQLYLEGVKSSFAGEYVKVLNGLYDKFAMYFGKMRYTSMDQFNRRELQDFIRLFEKEQQRFYSAYTEKLIELLKEFLAADVTVTNDIYDSSMKVRSIDESAKPLYGVEAISETDSGNSKLWAAALKEPIPATGHLLQTAVTNFINAAAYAVSSTLRKGYANAWTGQETLFALIGTTSRNFNDGLFAKLANQNSALVNTIIQHVSSTVNSAVGSSHTSQYQWVAILDSRTTEICWNRNGTIYIYGEGPLPPAHYNCRSRAIALLPGADKFEIPTSYLNWLDSQSNVFQNDLLGESRAEKLRNGSLDPKQLAFIAPLSIPQFISKIPFILGE